MSVESGNTSLTASLEQHRLWLRTIVQSRLGDQRAVDDVMQEVSLAVVQHARRSFQPRQIAPWLYRVTVRQVLLYRRKSGRRARTINGYGRHTSTVMTPCEPDPLDWIVALEQRALVRRALARLDERDRQILLLKHTENWTYKELAAKLGVSANAIEYRLLRARQALRRELVAQASQFRGDHEL